MHYDARIDLDSLFLHCVLASGCKTLAENVIILWVINFDATQVEILCEYREPAFR